MDRRRILTPLVGLVLAAAGLTSVSTTAEASTGPDVGLHVTKFFSPDGDGVKESARARWTLKRASDRVTLTVIDMTGSSQRAVLERRLGALDRGDHSFTWNGRDKHAKRLPDGLFRLTVVAEYAGRDATGSKYVRIDTSFVAQLGAERYDATSDEPNVVYPRTTDAVDALPLTAKTERFAKRAELVIEDRSGRQVLRRNVTNAEKFSTGFVKVVEWEARKRDEPLPMGRYRAWVEGVDKAGNRGASDRVRIFVSSKRLVLHEETHVFAAADTRMIDACDRIFTGNDCPLSFYCGTIQPSATVPGGLSHRSALCPPEQPYGISQAASVHLVEVPGAVHGIDRLRVGFAGSPTNPGETDPGTLRLSSDVAAVTSSSTGQSAWDEDPLFGNGRQPINFPEERIAPAAFWWFTTAGDDAFDVATFSVDLVYLALSE